MMLRAGRPLSSHIGFATLMFLLFAAPAPAGPSDAIATFEAGDLRIQLTSAGQVRSIYDRGRQREYSAEGHPAPLLSIDLSGKVEQPAGMVVTRPGRELKLTYAGSGVAATIEVKTHATHLALTLKQLSGATPERVLWGPFPTTIRETIGETVGVVRNAQFAFGIEGLNLKTSAGAGAADIGSVLHAKTKDRTRERIASSGDVKTVTVPALAGPDATLENSRIALFGCRADDTLDVIGRIEMAEGLPHPTLGGIWAKVSPEATRSYLIIPFDTRNLDEVLAIAGKADLKYIYHMDPFKSWGHFEPAKGAFPEGIESLRRCVERAEAVGVRVGVHTLSNFIHPHDPYVSPVPDPRLRCAGSSRLTAAVDEKATTIPVADPAPFRLRQSLSTAVLGQELVQYDAVSDKEPWMLLGCKRGSFRTTAAAHPADAVIGKLWDHPYKVFFPNLEMQDEIAARMVELFNRAGLSQISFDGLEGCQVTGEGDYAEARFVKQCYDGWRHEVISDSSQLKHYTWHIHTRMNWGEPWGKAMREGMPEYRFKNQEYFRRNLLPPMLGWFQIQAASADLEATSLDDVEWVLAKCAGFGAGCAWVTSVDTLKRLGETNAILEAIRQWDRARHLKAFSREQQERLKDAKNEFHLEPRGESRWQLTPVAFSPRFVYSPVSPESQPSAEARWEVDNRFGDQPLRFVLRVAADKWGAEEGSITNPTFVVGEQVVTFPGRVAPRQYLVCDGEGQVRLCDAHWKLLAAVKTDFPLPILRAGHGQVRFRCGWTGGLRLRVEIRYKTVGVSEPVS